MITISCDNRIIALSYAIDDSKVVLRKEEKEEREEEKEKEKERRKKEEETFTP